MAPLCSVRVGVVFGSSLRFEKLVFNPKFLLPRRYLKFFVVGLAACRVDTRMPSLLIYYIEELLGVRHPVGILYGRIKRERTWYSTAHPFPF